MRYSILVVYEMLRMNVVARRFATRWVLVYTFFVICLMATSYAYQTAITNDLFDEGDGPLTSAKIVYNLRKIMNDTNIVGVPIQAYIIPSVDAHQSEYIAKRDRRIEFISGFSGSAATVIICEQAAALWTDSRYFIQAQSQLDNETWTLMKKGLPDVPSIEEWLILNMPPNSRIGLDPFLIESTEFESLSSKLQSKGHNLVAIGQNLVDLTWKNRPEIKLADLEVLEYRFSGKRASEKVAEVRKAILKLDAESHIVSTLDDIAWLLNLRGSDIEMSPVFFSYVILSQTELHLFLMKKERISNRIENHFYLEGVDVIVHEYNGTLAGINTVIRSTTGKMILSQASQAVQNAVPMERRLTAESPIVMMKVIKNDVEARGIRNAHIRDGAALILYLHWLENAVDTENVTELVGARKLREFRSQRLHFKGLSFSTISAVGAHAAMAHYKPTPDTDKRITRDEIYLVDSGGQYWDGTTDITRTIHLGQPTDKERDAFTRVLKGFISLATSIFPEHAPYSFFDAMARRSLWDVGLDYGHGTGHGIGAYLNVHEFPPLISSHNNRIGMMRNMFTSNEPGYYEEGNFGIRIEDVIQVVTAPNTENYFNGKGALMFDCITMAPIQFKLMNVDLLSPHEIKFLNEYHERVRKNVTPILNGYPDVIEWLFNQTVPISPNSDANINNNSSTHIY